MKITRGQLRRLIREQIEPELVPGYPKLSAAIKQIGAGSLMKHGYSAEVLAVYVSLPVDMPIDAVKGKTKKVARLLQDTAGMSILDAYEAKNYSLQRAMRDAGLIGQNSDTHRVNADRFY